MVPNNDETVHRMAEMTWQEVESALESTSTLVLPIGSTEQHGHHMPLGVDVYMPEGVCERVAERTDCLLAPPVWYGVAPHHMVKPGSFTVESDTFRNYVRDVCVSAGEWGIENVLLVNGHYHGEDPELEIVVRELRNEHDMHGFSVPLVEVFRDAATEIRQSEFSVHAAEFETSIMLALRPDLVHMDRAVATEKPDEPPLPLSGQDILDDYRVDAAVNPEDWERLTDSGNVGDPTVATSETGEQLVAEAVDNITALVEELEARREQ